MYPSTNTLSGPIAPIEKNSVVPPTPPTSPYITKYDLDNTVNFIYTDIKADTKDINENITSINYNINTMLATLTDTNDKQKK